MADMLATGVSGLVAFQRALDTTSHNIANANTPGYSRQQVQFTSNPADPGGSGWVGTGVNAASVRRLFDATLASQAQGANSGFQQLDTLSSYASQLDNLFSDAATGMSATLQGFMNAAHAVADAPTDMASRQVLLSQAQTLTDRFKSYNTSLQSTDNQVATQMSSEATTVSTLASNIALLNKQVVAAMGVNQQPPNDLLDQRDQLVSELATHVNLTTVQQSDGALNVFIGSGQALVMNASAGVVSVGPDQFGAPGARLILKNGSGLASDITDAVSGGTIGGLVQFRTQMLQPARNALGQTAATLATLVNTQQGAGLDLQGQVGGPLFGIGAVIVRPSTANAGTAGLAVTRSDPTLLTQADYQVSYDGSAWHMFRTDTGAAVPLSGAGTAGSPLQGDGLAIVVSGSAQAGDHFLVQPTSGAVSGLSVKISQPERVAAAAQLLTSAATTNSGSGAIDAGTVTDTAAWPRGNFTLSFTAANAWQVLDASGTLVKSGSYVAGAPIAFNGVQVSVSGTPATGDSFLIKDNAGGTGDNRNALLIAGLLDKAVLNGGATTVNDSVGRMIGNIAVQTSQAQSGRDAQQIVLNDTNSAVSNLSGVNLDEEAANLVRFQQAYQAAAKVIGVANSLFQTLLDATK
jgi:flagellar hook-associated protein 1 FlgK